MFRLSGKSKLTAEVGENFSITVITDEKKRSRGGQCKISCTKKAAPIDKEEINNIKLLLNQTVDEFLATFNLPPIEDPQEKEFRAQVLKMNQQVVLENNEAYLARRKSWFETINEFSTILDDEFIATHTGLTEEVEQLNNTDIPLLRMEESLRSDVPASYNSVSQGYVSPVKDQLWCGSCTAFATMALVETCFKKKVGVFGDYSEQQLLDCAYGSYGIYGCSGTAGTTGYAKWLAYTKPNLASEETYPYTAQRGTCRADYEEFYQGAEFSISMSRLDPRNCWLQLYYAIKNHFLPYADS